MPSPIPLPEEGSLHRGVTVVKAFRMPSPLKAALIVSRGSVVHFSGDAIVNAANRGCLGGGGVDGAITAAGGPEMARERSALPILEGTKMDRCATGDAKITTGGALAAKKCIHAVGPNYALFAYRIGGNLRDADALLSSAYKRSVAVARESGEVKTMAFSLISAGVFRGPRSVGQVLEIGVRGVLEEALDGKDNLGPFTDLEEVHLVAFTEVEAQELIAAAERIVTEVCAPEE